MDRAKSIIAIISSHLLSLHNLNIILFATASSSLHHNTNIASALIIHYSGTTFKVAIAKGTPSNIVESTTFETNQNTVQHVLEWKVFE